MNAHELSHLISRYRFNYSNEQDLQQGIERVLLAASVEFEREVRLTSHDRIDFMAGDVGIEVKVGHTPAQVMRQIHRYAQLEPIKELLVVTSRCRHAAIPELVNEKPVVVIFLGWGMLH